MMSEIRSFDKRQWETRSELSLVILGENERETPEAFVRMSVLVFVYIS